MDDKKLIKLINGALKNTIDVHGPITSAFISSASKRILGHLKNHVDFVEIQDDEDVSEKGSIHS